jgi:cytochrome b subunit of formate dehydrogenase
MVLHWLVDLQRQLGDLMREGPQVVRMRPSDVWQHTLLMVSFVVLVITGFALVYDTSWFAELFFGWSGGFDFRGDLHRIAAVVFIATAVWHLVFVVAGGRGRAFLGDMWPRPSDLVHFWQRFMYNLRRREQRPLEGRFTYVEKAEYWALVWGTAVMIASGLLMWFDDWFSTFLPQGVLDVARAMHFWEAWLATLAIIVWHLYSTVFNPEVYPMNPSWLTGRMPAGMHRREHPACDPDDDEDPPQVAGGDEEDETETGTDEVTNSAADTEDSEDGNRS